MNLSENDIAILVPVILFFAVVFWIAYHLPEDLTTSRWKARKHYNDTVKKTSAQVLGSLMVQMSTHMLVVKSLMHLFEEIGDQERSLKLKECGYVFDPGNSDREQELWDIYQERKQNTLPENQHDEANEFFTRNIMSKEEFENVMKQTNEFLEQQKTAARINQDIQGLIGKYQEFYRNNTRLRQYAETGR